MTDRLKRLGGLALLWLLTKLPGVEIVPNEEAFDEDEPDPTSLTNLGPVIVEYDWEGDLVSVYPGNKNPSDQLAAWLMVSHAIRSSRGERETYCG